MEKDECLELFERFVSNSATDDEVRLLSRWINHDHKVSKFLEQHVLNSSALIDREVKIRMLKNIEKLIDQDNDNLSFTKGDKYISIQKWLRIAAMFILPVLSTVVMYFFMSKNDAAVSTGAPLIISVERGQKANITLPDGSRVWLNSQSKLIYTASYNTQKRELKLDGEAYFEVAHNPQKPFIVQSRNISVEALGTGFGINAYSEDNLISSILMHGKIRVTTPVGSEILFPNERVLFDKRTNRMNKQSVANATDFTGWIHNKLRFENETLQEMAIKIQRIYNIEVVFADERIKYFRYTGTINNNSLESVLNVISLSSPVGFKIINQQVILSDDRRN